MKINKQWVVEFITYIIIHITALLFIVFNDYMIGLVIITAAIAGERFGAASIIKMLRRNENELECEFIPIKRRNEYSSDTQEDNK